MAKKKSKGTYPLAFDAGTNKSRNASFEAWYGDYHDWLTKSPANAEREQSKRLQMKAKAKFDLAPEGGKKREGTPKTDREDR